MKQFIKTMCILSLIGGLVFPASRILKSDLNLKKLKKVESDYRKNQGPSRPEPCAIIPGTDYTGGALPHIDGSVGLIDSSSNGSRAI